MTPARCTSAPQLNMAAPHLNRDHQLPPGLVEVEKRTPIRTVIVESDEFERISQSLHGALQGISSAMPLPNTQVPNTPNTPNTPSTIPMVGSTSQLDSTPPASVSPKTPESKPPVPMTQLTSQTRGSMATSFHTSALSHVTSKSHSLVVSPTATAVQKNQTTSQGAESEHHDIGGIIIGFVAAGITTAVICLLLLFFFCRHKRKREVAEGNGEQSGGKGLFGRGASRSASQNSGGSRRKLLLTRNLTRGSDEKPGDNGSEDETWRPNDAVHYPPYQHIPRNLGIDGCGAESREPTSRAVSPSSAETPLPDMPTRPPTLEIRSPPLNHRPSLPIELRTIAPSNPPIAGLARPKTAYGPAAGPSRYSLVPANGRGAQRGSNKPFNKNMTETVREIAETLTALENAQELAPPSRPSQPSDSASTRSFSPSPSVAVSRNASQSPKRNTTSSRPPPPRRGSMDEPAPLASNKNSFSNLPALHIPNSSTGGNTPRPGVSRTTSFNSLREDASGIPMVWTNGDQQSPKASPTVGYEPSMELQTLLSRQSSRRATSTVQLVLPESPIDGTMNSISTTNSSILNTFKRESNPLPIPDKSPLRGISPGRSIKSISPPPHTRAPSPCSTDDENTPTTPVRMRRRNTGYRPSRPLSKSPPPALPPLPITSEMGVASSEARNTAITRTSSGSTMHDSLSRSTASYGTWSQTTTFTNANRASGSRPHSYTGPTNRLSLPGLKDAALSRFSFAPIQEALSLPSDRINAIARTPPSAEEAVDSFFQATQDEPGTETARPSFEELEETEPQLARYVSITSTSGSCRTTIEYRSNAGSRNSRVLSRSTIRSMDMPDEYDEDDDADVVTRTDTCTDIEDVTATYTASSINRTNSSASAARRGRPRSLRDYSDMSDNTNSAYSPTLSMLNFYSSPTERCSIAAAPPSTRSSLATRRNSQVPNISIPQPQLYTHPNTQLEILHYEEAPAPIISRSAHANAMLSTGAPGATGSLSSATSPVSFTTASSSSASSSSSVSPHLNPRLDIGARLPMDGTLVPIPTPQIYSSSTEDFSPEIPGLQLQRQPSYLAFPKQYYGDLDTSSPDYKQSVESLAIPGNNSPSKLEIYVDAGIGAGTSERNISLGTESTLDHSSFRDLDTKSSSEVLEFSSDEAASSGANDTRELDLEIGSCSRVAANAVEDGTRRKRKRSAMMSGFYDGRGRSRERRLV
ncbi:hypothetical protein TWF696_003714 [Orbilia brochopaga]|uniref:Uncharacterized protein n=1 Tax=Orbilia brochopaga TaxID=3140254 RepID=A0AAV9V6L2_9PEZI